MSDLDTIPGHRDGHAIRLTLTDQTVSIAVVCPFSPAWDDSYGQPDGPVPECRRLRDHPPSVECQVEAAVFEMGAEAIDLPDGEAVPVTTEDVPIAYRWEGDHDEADFYIRPLAASEVDVAASRNQREAADR